MPRLYRLCLCKKSKRYVSPEKAKELKSLLSPDIKAVGVFVDESIENIAKLLSDNIIDLAQLHGSEDEEYIARLKALTDKPVIKAFCIKAKTILKVLKTAKLISFFSIRVQEQAGALIGTCLKISTGPIFLQAVFTPKT